VFLGTRAMYHEDVRFSKVKGKPGLFLIYWLVQAVWIFITNLPVLLALFYGTVDSMSIVGPALFVLGFLVESIADQQKKAFRARDPSGFIHEGLWSICRHPNYLGEIVLQLGIAFTSAATLEGAVLSLIPFICPAFTAFLLVRVSGIPILKRIAEKRYELVNAVLLFKPGTHRYGTDPSYIEYKKKTALLIPFVW
jgi:steroid 5-alpha reductase family enzyme